ncbi:SOS response-associated peptidase [Temperatibacter marinus]|uniref:Abasic site processing protein n=1 Tax=Temperatibacter marinus TaxID=1456591 RepID=A0AA52HA07_9PROT|nr:SOS response-associated peptidase [Temperatibacter marinus]WND03112.1 SOS response-associated peptidase [Temperatibacter marinus]
MCGRFSLTATEEEIAEAFGVYAHSAIPERYNVAPTQPILSVRSTPRGKRELAALEWGLVPEWSKEGRKDRPLINARVETVEEKASFKSPLRRTRCLVPFNGWYEWKTVKGRKQPYYITPRNGAVHAFAGLWAVWHGQEGEHWLETTAFITAEAQGPLKAVHHRKPLVVSPESYQRWLKPEDPLPRNFWDSLTFLPETDFDMRPVSSRVNSARFDDSSCIDPPEEEMQGSLF